MTKSSERPKVGLAKSKARAVAPGSAVKVPAAIDEAALLTGQSPALVKVNIHRGLSKLAALVEGYDDVA